MSMSGVEGRLKVHGASELKVKGYKIKSDPNLQEDTNGTTGGVQTANTVKIKHEVTGTVLLGSNETPESLGLGPGAAVILDLRVGTSPNGYMNWSGIMGATEVTGNDPNGFAEVSFTWQASVAKPSPSTYS